MGCFIWCQELIGFVCKCSERKILSQLAEKNFIKTAHVCMFYATKYYLLNADVSLDIRRCPAVIALGAFSKL